MMIRNQVRSSQGQTTLNNGGSITLQQTNERKNEVHTKVCYCLTLYNHIVNHNWKTFGQTRKNETRKVEKVLFVSFS